MGERDARRTQADERDAEHHLPHAGTIADIDHAEGSAEVTFIDEGELPDVGQLEAYGRGAPSASERGYGQHVRTAALTATATKKPAATKKEPPARYGKELTDTSYLDSQQVMTGGASIGSIKTNPETEAKALNSIRGHQKKFEPIYLKGLQEALGVSNASGAFNTETLRALRAHYKGSKTQVSVASIMAGTILTSIHPGTPFRDTATGFGTETRGSSGEMDDKSELRADALAQALGYKNYAGMLGDFQPVVLLGKTLGEGLPHLAAKVNLASAFLREHFSA